MSINPELYLISICYLFGSIPFGLVISKILKRDDPRSLGSKNIGATNILRISGVKLGFITLLCDILKAFIPIKVLSLSNSLSLEIAIISVFIGHLFPFWIKFKGGKGIAVLIGAILAYKISFALLFLLTWIIVAILTRYSSLAALVACIFTFLFMFIEGDKLVPVMFVMLILVIFKHYNNIKRLIRGKETKIILKKVK